MDINTLKSLFRDKNFVKLWSVGAASMGNQWLEMLAITVFIYNATQSPLAVTFANFARAVPMIFLGGLTGVISDYFSKKKILIAAYGLLVISSLLLAIISYLNLIEIWHIIIGMTLTGIVFSTDFPVRRNMLGELAGSDRVGSAMGFDSIARNATRILGPFLGGTLMEYSGLHGAYLILGFFYAFNMYQIIKIKEKEIVTEDLNKDKENKISSNYFKDLINGINFARKEPSILGFLLITVTMNLFAFPYMIMVPVIAQTQLDISPLLIGILVSADGLGAVAGATVISLLGITKLYKSFYFFGSFIVLVGICLFGFSHYYFLSILIMLFTGIGMGGFTTMQSTLPFILAPKNMRARVLGLISVGIGMNPLGILLVGFLAVEFGPSLSIIICSIIGISVLVGLLIINKKTL